MTTLNSLSDLYLLTIRELHSAEGQLADALPRLTAAASNADLRGVFDRLLAESREHQRRLEHISRGLRRSPRGARSRGMHGLVEEARELVRNEGDADVCDAALVAAAQRIAHYQIACYGCARSYALKLTRDLDLRLLDQSRIEEREADRALTRIAERVTTRGAMRDRTVERRIERDADWAGAGAAAQRGAGRAARSAPGAGPEAQL